MNSPCRRACALNTARTLCTGCGRTVEEITRWSRMTDEERQAVMNRLKEQQA